MRAKAFDLAGQTFGRWTVLETLPGSQNVCRCACGTTAIVLTWTLSAGRTRSCGCRRNGLTERYKREQDLRITGEIAPRCALVWQRDGGLCHLCGETADRAAWEMDHVIPIAEYGPHCMDNVAVACRGCHKPKCMSISWDSPAFPRAAAAYARLHGVEISQDVQKRLHDLGLPLHERLPA